ncbi:MAG: hypothetical protein IKO35_04470 [Elusimicrobiaceae bacterium]|nr:hypothetical protein [Elusimicrobiaceae bacterium]
MGIVGALIFSLIAPGAGHILTGHFAQGILLGGLFALGKSALLPLALRLFKVKELKRVLHFFYVCNCGYILLIFYAVISAVWYGFYATQMYVLQAIVCAICVGLIYKRTQNKFIFTALCGRSGIYELMQKMHKSQTVKK